MLPSNQRENIIFLEAALEFFLEALKLTHITAVDGLNDEKVRLQVFGDFGLRKNRSAWNFTLFILLV